MNYVIYLTAHIFSIYITIFYPFGVGVYADVRKNLKGDTTT